jgi:formylglycine-generating enzyme required for sulfatase activity
VGQVERDVSPYGARDMGTGIHEWTASVYEPSRLSECDLSAALGRLGYLTTRGGISANRPRASGQAAVRRPFMAGTRLPSIGFRLVRQVPWA